MHKQCVVLPLHTAGYLDICYWSLWKDVSINIFPNLTFYQHLFRTRDLWFFSIYFIYPGKFSQNCSLKNSSPRTLSPTSQSVWCGEKKEIVNHSEALCEDRVQIFFFCWSPFLLLDIHSLPLYDIPSLVTSMRRWEHSSLISKLTIFYLYFMSRSKSVEEFNTCWVNIFRRNLEHSTETKNNGPFLNVTIIIYMVIIIAWKYDSM